MLALEASYYLAETTLKCPERGKSFSLLISVINTSFAMNMITVRET